MGAGESLQLGRYQLVRKLATGGMAEVFLAKAIGPGGFEKSLVIKCILPNLAQDPEFVEMFLHEARLAAQLNHPNVVQIFDFGEVDGTYYLAMEYVDGPNLRSVLRRAPGRRMPVTLGAKLIAQACEGLAYAHEFADPVTGQPLGLIHRDVSADNLLVARNGTVKVVDFGVAKVEGQATKDEPGVVKGKIAYMPPEQIAGDADLRADVYALGVILYELAAGVRPYDQETDNELMAAIIQRDPVPLLTRVPDLPVGYAMVVGKAMARHRDERFASCRELQVALEDFLHSTGERVGSVHLAQFVASVVSGPSSGTYPRVGTSPGTGPGARGTPVSGPSGVRPATGSLPTLSPPGTGRTKTGQAAVPPGVAPAIAPVVPPPGASAPRARTGAFPSVPPVSPATLPEPRLTPGRSAATGTRPAVDAGPAPRFTPTRSAPTGTRPAVEPPPAPPPVDEDTDGMKVTITSRGGNVPVAAPLVKAPPPLPVDPFAATSPGWMSPVPPAPPSPPPAPSRPSQVSAPPASRPSRPPEAPPPSRPSQPPAPLPFAQGPRSSAPSGVRPSSVSRTGTFAALEPSLSTSIGALSSDVFAAPPSASEWELDVPTGVGTAPDLQPAPPALTPGSPEARAAQVLADGEALRSYEPGGPLASDDSLAAELERDETVNLLGRFALHGARLMPVHPHAPGMVQERVAGAVEGLVTAEAWGPLARLLERLEAQASSDANSQWVWTVALGAFATAEQAQRVLERLREVAPGDPEAFGRCLRYFGPDFIAPFLEAFEQLELAGSREALLYGLAELARLKQDPFIARVLEERPRRLADFVWALEKGRAGDRQRAIRQVLGRRDPGLRKEVLTGMARARTDEALNLVVQALGDRDEAVRVHGLELLAKHFPERAFRHAEPLLVPETYEARSATERQALWRAVGSSTQPEAYYCLVDVLKQKPPLLQRARVQQLKLEALEGLAVMRTDQGRELMRAVADDTSQPGPVVDAAKRLLASPPLPDAKLLAGERRWDRIASTPRAFLRDLSALAQAARLVDVASPVFDLPFRRLRVRLAGLLQRDGGLAVTVGNKQVLVNGIAAQEGEVDAPMTHFALMCARYQVGGFSVTGAVEDRELRELARWLAEGPCAAGVTTPHIQRQVLGASPPARPVTPAPAFADPSREAMTRYVDLIFSLKEFLAAQRGNPKLRPGDAQRTLDELAWAMQSRTVRFLGLTPKAAGRESVAFHHANVAVLALGFAAELRLPIARLRELAEVAFFHDVGMYELGEDTLTRAGELTAADKEAIQVARRSSAWFPFERLGADRRAVAWATAIVEYGLDWGAKDATGAVVQRTEVGVVGGILSLAKTYDALTSKRTFRAAMSPEAALDVMTTKVSYRFRPDLLPLFAAFVKRHRVRALGG
jgi:serine/threonine-protein kinase